MATITTNDGTAVIVGPRNLRGLSAYEVWIEEGNTGTEQDFLDSLATAATATATTAATAAQAAQTAAETAQTGAETAETNAATSATSAATSATASAASATASAASETNAEASELAAAASATAAADSEDSAADSAVTATAAADAASLSSLSFYDTKADADTDLASIAEGADIEVYDDEDRWFRRSRYRKESGVLVWKAYLPQTYNGRPITYASDTGTRLVVGDADNDTSILPHFYVDHSRGTSGTDGRSHAQAFKDFADLIASDAVQAQSGKLDHFTIAVRNGNDVARDGLDSTTHQSSDYVSIVGYGPGDPTFLDGTDEADAGDFSAHSTISDAYEITWDTSALGRFDAASPTEANFSRLRVFQEGKPLKRVETEAETSAEGTYWYDATILKSGSVTVVIHAYDDSDPTSDGLLYEITSRDAQLRFDNNCFVQGIWMRRSGSRNGSLFLGNRQRTVAVLVEEGQDHNIVLGAGHSLGVFAVNCAGDDEYLPAAYSGTTLINTFYNATNGLAGMTAIWEDGACICDPSVYGDTISVGAKTANCFTTHNSIDTMIFRDFQAIGLRQPNMGGDARLTIFDKVLQDEPEQTTLQPTNFRTNDATGRIEVYNSLIRHKAYALFAADVKIRSSLFITQTGDFGQIAAISSAFLSADEPLTADIEDTFFISTAAADPWPRCIVNASRQSGGTLNFKRNATIGWRLPWQANANQASPSPAATITADENVYVYRAGDALEYIARIENAYETLAGVQGLGYDTNSVGVDTADAGLIIEAVPTFGAEDIRALEAGNINQKMRNPITQAEIDYMLAKPKTLAAVKEYLRQYPTAPVIW
jgi:hypothetical protein